MPRSRRPGPCFQRPNSQTGASSGPFSAPRQAQIPRRIPGNLGQESPAPQPRPAGGVVIPGTHLGATGGTQTHARRTGRKLRQLCCARQALVRVPESNTKYGGIRGKTGGRLAPSVKPSISESSGNPKRKKLFRRPGFRLRPLFTGQLFIVPTGLPSRDSREATGGWPGWHARSSMASGRDNPQGAG